MNNYGNLKTVNNYAKERGCTVGYIYKLIREKKIVPVKIDGVIFIDTKKLK
jgi:hypothetical protein